MVFDQNFKDNLTLMGNRDKPRYLMPLLVLLAGATIAVIIYYAYSPHKQRSQTAATDLSKKPAVSLKMDQRMLGAIKTMIASNNIASARQKCYELLQNSANTATVSETEKMLGQININLLLSPAPMPEKTEYIVQSGDILEQLAKKNGTTVELIRKCNSLQGTMIHPGDRLRIFNAKFALVINKSRNDLLLKAGNRFFKRYPVGTGKFGTTPAGTFVISDKISEPPWWRPDGKMIPFGDKENVLGTRWMSLTATGATPKVRGYGIHGTWEPDTISKQASAGCVRLLNSDVEELFIIIPTGTPVTIAE
ncbi:MAG: L,D-transpeptidase family protein [Kiritimatiellia bacterium]|nr:L,D-transpeptidase family protein [Kiritimatiellia bacterium]